MNDRERELWVLNDEGLYMWWKSARAGITTFIQKDRKEITEVIEQQMIASRARRIN